MVRTVMAVLVVLLAGCLSNGTEDGVDDPDGGIGDAWTPPPEPVTLDAFEQQLIVEACAGMFGSPNANPMHRAIIRIADEKTCRAVLQPEHLVERWPRFIEALDAGELTYDGVAAARCLTQVADALGSGYFNWMLAGDCTDVLDGFKQHGDPCVPQGLCPPQYECRESKCDRPEYGCLDTHECEDGEWCVYYNECRPIEPKKEQGDDCVVFTDDGWPEDCDRGLICPWIGYDEMSDDLWFGASCIIPNDVGGSCVRDTDCKFGLTCGGCDAPPCPDAACQAM